jgi:hypothetical protein
LDDDFKGKGREPSTIFTYKAIAIHRLPPLRCLHE